MTELARHPLGKVISGIQTGSTPSTSRSEFFGGDIPWFTPGDIGDQQYLKKSSRSITELALKEGRAKLFYENSLLVTCIGNVGRVGILRVKASSNQQITSITFNDNISVSFAYYWFLANQKKLQIMATQAVVPILNNNRLKEIEFEYPPLPEQHRIAAMLDKADRLRRLRRYALQLGDGYLQSVFLEIFGDPSSNPYDWKSGKIGDVIAFSQYGTSTRSNDEQVGYPVLGMGNITYAGEIYLADVSYVDIPEDEFENLRLEQGDIIFNRTNSTELVGKTAFWDVDIDAVLASYLVRLRLSEELMPEYFTALLNSSYFKSLFQLRCRKAVGQSNISPTYLKEFPVLIPPISLQEKYAKVVKHRKHLRLQQRESLRQADHLFQSLLHNAFGN